MLRYHFSNQHVDLYIPSGPSYNVMYKRELDSALTTGNTPVTLTYLTYSPGVDVLVELAYQHLCRINTTVIPLETKERKHLLYWSGVGIAIVWSILFFIAFIGIAASRFNLHTTIVMLSFILPIALIAYVSWRFLRQPVKLANNKIVITSSITEKITAREKTRYSYKRFSLYRLEDGELYETKDARFAPGDNIVIQFVEDMKGNKGRLISVSRK